MGLLMAQVVAQGHPECSRYGCDRWAWGNGPLTVRAAAAVEPGWGVRGAWGGMALGMGGVYISLSVSLSIYDYTYIFVYIYIYICIHMCISLFILAV